MFECRYHRPWYITYQTESKFEYPLLIHEIHLILKKSLPQKRICKQMAFQNDYMAHWVMHSMQLIYLVKKTLTRQHKTFCDRFCFGCLLHSPNFIGLFSKVLPCLVMVCHFTHLLSGCQELEYCCHRAQEIEMLNKANKKENITHLNHDYTIEDSLLVMLKVINCKAKEKKISN